MDVFSEPDSAQETRTKQGQQKGRKDRHRQSLAERYAGGHVNPIVTDQYSNMKPNKQRKRANNKLLDTIYDILEKRSDGPEIRNIGFAMEFIIEGAALILETDYCSSAERSFVTAMKQCRHLIVNWLLPSLQSASLRVCPEIMEYPRSL